MADEEPTAQSQRGPSSRRTRSQAAPEWSAVAELVLVNEIAAVESDCATELSSYQKWKIIAENCAAQDVPRTLSQCRRKWDSLLEDYRRVQKFESLRSRKASSYWSLQSERREKLGLPRSFDRELFSAIGDLLRARENQPESEPDEDSETKDDGAETVEELGAGVGAVAVVDTSADARIYMHAKGSRKKRQRLTSQGKRSWKSLAEESLSESFAKAKPLQSQEEEEEKPPESLTEKSPIKSSTKETPPRSPAQEEPQEISTKQEPQKDQAEEDEPAVDIEDKERMVALILGENAERINSIVAETAGYDDNIGSFERSEDGQTKSDDFIRRRGDELIACLGVIVKTLDQLCNLAQECK